MKADRNFHRNGSADAEEVFKRATKLAPNRKSGKERHSLYTQFDEEEEDAAFGYKAKQESVLDDYDDGEEGSSADRARCAAGRGAKV